MTGWQVGRLFLWLGILLGTVTVASAESIHYVATDGHPQNRGTADSPWDIASAWSGQQTVAPGATVLMKGGTYRHPDRSWASPGYAIALQGTEEFPIRIRPVDGQRVTIDGRVEVKPDSRYLELWDLEITVSETATWDRQVTAGGLELVGDHQMPQGGLNILGGGGSKFINLVIHDMYSGVGFWRPSLNAELHGCLIFGIGGIGPDRYHGPGIYTQNEEGTKRLTDNILFDIHSTTIQAYGSQNASVSGFAIEGNIAFAPIKAGNRQKVLVGGGRPSRRILVAENLLYEVPLQLGYTAPYNENAVVRDNLIVHAGLSIQRFQSVEESGNLVIGAAEIPTDRAADIKLRPNRYDPRRAHLAVFNWRRDARVAVDLSSFLRVGEGYRILNVLDYDGQPVSAGSYDGRPIEVAVPVEERTGRGQFCAYVVSRESAR
ncbi:MAG: hypothetical protein EA381_12820 [Planctomycetaceae bacterium]|nr:MAG: hypothetical protein EA381_12820 [Planctomycetaceae bacterium]